MGALIRAKEIDALERIGSNVQGKNYSLSSSLPALRKTAPFSLAIRT